MSTFSCRSTKSCENCTGCAVEDSEVILAPDEVLILMQLSQTPWLPLGAKKAQLVFRELKDSDGALYVKSLENKGVISVSLQEPLKGFSYKNYEDCDQLGSIGLTEYGMRLLDALDIRGVEDV
ncbi:MAG: hypothetical protein IJ744_12125 [Lachnospiraceae bacterium]|nr:hypothetical protein [Lachnospiraceae bacterium]